MSQSPSLKAVAFASAAGALALSACSTVPRDKPAAPPLPQAWTGAPEETGAVERINWWTGFNDPVLDGLVDEALQSGPSVRLAALRVREARALSFRTFSAFLPQVSGVARGSYNEITDGAARPRADGGSESALGTSTYGAQVSWEIPLFQRIQAAAVGSRANTRAAQQDVRGAQVALAADIADAYVSLRAARSQKAALAEAVDLADQLAKILDVSAKAGFAAPADAADARRLAESARARLPDAEITARQSQAVLAVLRGKAPGTERPELQAEFDVVRPAPTYPLFGPPLTPAELIRARPDVAQAEARAMLAAAEVGIARVDLLPQLSLSGLIGVTDNVYGKSLSQSVTQIQATPIVTIPLIGWGNRLANIRATRARFDQALISYETTVTQAIQESSNALVSLAEGDRRLIAARAAEGAAKETARGVRAAYQAGIASLSDRLRADQQLIDARLTRIQAEAQQGRAAVATFRAFAGGPALGARDAASTATAAPAAAAKS
jgi:NodT family efflux transporter outer membrane factor (OMF) lipoprotein